MTEGQGGGAGGADRAGDHQADRLARSGLRGGAFGFYDLANPGIISIPLGFIGCWLGTMLSTERKADRSFDELFVRSETGLGAETGTGLTLTDRKPAQGTTAAAATTTQPPA